MSRRATKLRRRGTLDQRIRRLRKWLRARQWRLIWNNFPTVARMFVNLPRENGAPISVTRGRRTWFWFDGSILDFEMEGD